MFIFLNCNILVKQKERTGVCFSVFCQIYHYNIMSYVTEI